MGSYYSNYLCIFEQSLCFRAAATYMEPIKIFKLLLVSFFLFSTSSYGQVKCDCLANLDKTVREVEENYAGFPVKVTEKNKIAYQVLKADLQTRAAASDEPASCYSVLADYVNYFYDKHFRIEYNAPIDSSVLKIDITQIRQIYSKSKQGLVTGIWVNPEGTEIAIMKQKDGSFKAIKLTSTTDTYPEGFVYFTLWPKNNGYTVKLYNRKINLEIPAKLVGNLLKIWSFQLWAKANDTPLTESELEELASWKENNHGLLFKRLNNDFSYLKIPTFENNEGNIQSVVAKNDSIIRNTKYLIIDLTGNGGGGAGWVSLMPYLMTNQINQEPSFLRVSKINVEKKLRDIEPFAKHPIPDEYKKYFPEAVVAQYKEAYDQLPKTNSTFYPTPAVDFPLDTILTFPSKVAVIVDDFGGSSTEYFFYLTKQSKKVITYGQPTVGMMDYAGMSIPTELPYPAFKLYVPIEKSSWTDLRPIDRTGFIPQILINEKQEKWITYIMQDLQKR